MKLLNVGPSETVYVVDPKGRIRYHRTRPNVTHRAISYQGNGRWGLSGWGASNGWSMLESLYAADPDPDLRERGYQVWLDYNEHAKKNPTREVGEFPVEWLPKEVIDRRERNPKDRVAEFAAPEKKKKPGRPKGSQ